MFLKILFHSFISCIYIDTVCPLVIRSPCGTLTSFFVYTTPSYIFIWAYVVDVSGTNIHVVMGDRKVYKEPAADFSHASFSSRFSIMYQKV